MQYESDRTDADAVPRLERQPVQAGGPMSLSGHPSEAAIAVAADVDVDPINPVTAQEEEAMRRGMAPAFGGVPAVASAAAVAGAGTDATDDRAQHVDDHTPQLEDNNRNLSQYFDKITFAPFLAHFEPISQLRVPSPRAVDVRCVVRMLIRRRFVVVVPGEKNQTLPDSREPVQVPWDGR